MDATETNGSLPTAGVLKKWTNFMGGWQERYFEVRDGNLVYYKSKADKAFGCRGSISLRSMSVTLHEFDPTELIVSVAPDISWYLKAPDANWRNLWFHSLTKEVADSDYSSTSTKSHSRNPSLSSTKLHDREEDDESLLISALTELQAYRTMCRDQMQSIERLLEQGNAPTKQSVLSIKATHLAMIANVDHIIDLVKCGKACLRDSKSNVHPLLTPSTPSTPPISSRTSSLHEHEYRSNSISEQASEPSTLKPNSSNLDVTSDCDEWHDADEHSSFGSVDQGEECRESMSSSPSKQSRASHSSRSSPEVEKKEEKEDSGRHGPVHSQSEPILHVEKPPAPVKRNLPFGHYDSLEMPKDHLLFSTVDKLAEEQLKYALAGVEDNVWTLFAEDGPMKMFTRQVEDEGGLPIDPLKALHHVQGVTALEFTHYFYEPVYKMSWDHTLDSMKVVEQISKDTAVLHQLHKTVWPAAARESLFVSHIRRVDHLKRDGCHDLYIVTNKDVKRQDVPLTSSSALRVGLTVSMICETIVKTPEKPLNELTRDDIACNVIYVSQVFPGGWVPVAALRAVYKREYPKFLRTFTEYVKKNLKDKPVVI
ncbi:hypothetical protein WR25_11905 [Diploscapter pachys]|uniref:Collagen type IV alpha-3-binding protein n=1 Tax=Diploscapter pachys TaxID=2018661 RepID=A0A2A2J8Z8_9BILA|nr:hypothetical protein WR25_11905 [Diploscapter pachys]